MDLNKESTVPLFEQVKEDIASKIKSGLYQAGTKIPTEQDLIHEYQVSRITIRRAIDDLCKLGLLIKRQGKGTFVQEKRIFRKIEHNTSFSDSCRANGMTPSALVKKKEILTPGSKAIPSHPGLENDSVIYIQRVRCADDIPIMLENNYYPCSRYPFLLTEPLDGSLYDILKQNNIFLGCSQHSYIDTLKASSEQAALLSISPGDPLFFLYTELYDIHNELVYVGREYIVGVRYRFNYENS